MRKRKEENRNTSHTHQTIASLNNKYMNVKGYVDCQSFPISIVIETKEQTEKKNP